MPRFPLFLGTEPETLPTIEPIVTEYSDVTIPISLLVIFVVMAVVLLAAVVVAFIFIKNRGTNFGQSIMFALLFYLGINYFVFNLSLYGLQMLPGVADFAKAHNRTMQLFMLFWEMLLSMVSMYLGLRYAVRQSRKRAYYIDICTALIYGLVFYTAALFVSRHLVFSIEYTIYGGYINSVGFDAAVTSMVQNGAKQDEAIATILDFARQKPIDHVFYSLNFILTGIQQTTAAVVLYGLFTDQLEKRWLLGAAAIYAGAYLGPAVSVIFKAPVFVNTLVSLAANAAAVYVVWRLLNGPMSKEMYTLTHKKVKEEKQKPDEPEKMPTIVMPKD